jgi:hypothetical protein
MHRRTCGILVLAVKERAKLVQSGGVLWGKSKGGAEGRLSGRQAVGACVLDSQAHQWHVRPESPTPTRTCSVSTPHTHTHIYIYTQKRSCCL